MSKCTVCNSDTVDIGYLPFDSNAVGVPIVDDTPIHYVRCKSCFSVSAPTMLQWSDIELASKVYNSEYVKYDPSYLTDRPNNYYKYLKENVKHKYVKNIRHLDYGSGAGIMVAKLKNSGWNSKCYDPFSHNVRPTTKFNFVSAIEVIEHSKDVQATLVDILSFMEEDGVALITSHLSKEDTGIDWWYLNPRGGHINIMGVRALQIIARRLDVEIFSNGINFHIMCRKEIHKKKVLGW